MTQTQQMTFARDYLSQAFQIDQLIQNKLDQTAYLQELEAVTQSAMARACGASMEREDPLQRGVSGIDEMKQAVSAELGRLMDTKKEISLIIQNIASLSVRSVLEQRYLCHKPWQDIAEKVGCSQRQVYNIHRKGLQLVGSILQKPHIA